MFDFDTLTDRDQYGALKWDRRSAEEKALGIVPMSVADMEFPVAPCVKEMVMRSAENALYGYTDPEERFYRAVCRWMRLRHGWEVRADEISCLYGVVPALSAAIRAFTREGDGVLIQTPVYYPFGDMIQRNGRTVVENPLIRGEDGRYRMDFEQLSRAARGAKLMLLCSPHNPVGRVWTREELETVRGICRERGVMVVSDEIHFDLILSGTHTPYAKLDPDTVVMTAPSKTFNVPGLQLANMVIPNPEIKRAFDGRIHADGFSNISHFGWAATVGAYESGEAWLDALIAYLRDNFRAFQSFFAAEFPDFTVTPLEGTYLAWVDFRPLGLRGRALEAVTRGKARLVLDEGYIFGPQGDGFERFNIALPRTELMRNLERLKKAIKG